MNSPLRLNTAQRQIALSIYSKAVHESTYHINRIRSLGCNLFTRAGKEITLSSAISRRRRCFKFYKQAVKGFIA